MFSRRRFLSSTATSAAALVAVPQFLLRLSQHAAAADASGRDAGDGKVLVVVQLGGGNDGLNTVVPHGDDAYHRNRFTLRVTPQEVIKIDQHVGLHPSMTGFKKLLDAGKLAVVQGVGYPNPNRSHFASMDIWHTARLDAAQDAQPARRTGWIGRCLDASFRGATPDVPALHLGDDRQPLAVVGQDVRVPSIQALESFQLRLANEERLRRCVQDTVAAPRPAGDDLLQFIQRSTVTALGASDRVRRAAQGYRSNVKYPGDGFSQRLRSVAQLIDARVGARVFYLTHNGFDTHANQAGAHAALLKELSEGLEAFQRDLAEHGHAGRTLTLCFSEFGRRIKENASRGTDHGAAAPLFLVGDGVRPGVIGKHPSLTETDEGDLIHHTDFRQVYATILDRWMGLDHAAVLGRKFAPAAVLARM